MELRQLTYFAAVARHGGFTRAAQALHVAQSAISAQIRALERELGTPLFTRTTRRVALTQAGTALLARAENVLAELDAARADIADLAAAVTGHVTLGATAVLGSYDLPAALAAFHTRHPGVAVTLRSNLVAGLLAELDEGTLDLAVGPIHPGLPSRFSATLLAEEHLVLAFPPGAAAPTPFASGEPVNLADLRDAAWVCLSATSGLRQLLDEAARAAGFTPDVRFETYSAAAVRELVSAGLGIALLARSAAGRPGPPITIRTPNPPVPHPPIGLLRHRDRRLSPAALACRRHLMAFAVPAGSPVAGDC